eukprot:g22785.t1
MDGKESTSEDLPKAERLKLLQEAAAANVLCAIDWTGARALKSLPLVSEIPFVYMNFRVYSSGVRESSRQRWFDDMELQALAAAPKPQRVVALSEKDREKLVEMATYGKDGQPIGVEGVEVLLPPLRGDLLRILDPARRGIAGLEPQHEAKLPELAKLPQQRCLVSCVVRLSQEKQVLRFVRFIQESKKTMDALGLVPFLAGASAEEAYAARVKQELREVAPEAIIMETFLTPQALSAIFARTALKLRYFSPFVIIVQVAAFGSMNFHPCAYDAYGMTAVEAAACGAPSALGAGVGALALLKEAVLLVDMPEEEEALPQKSVEILEAALKDQESLQCIGESAKSKALAWDEMAYGRRLLEILSTAVGG